MKKQYWIIFFLALAVVVLACASPEAVDDRTIELGETLDIYPGDTLGSYYGGTLVDENNGTTNNSEGGTTNNYDGGQIRLLTGGGGGGNVEASASASVSWLIGEWSLCSAQCGGGTQTRTVECYDFITGQTVDDMYCTAAKPVSTQDCNTQPCTSPGPTPIPEFSTIAIPVGAILGLLFFFNRRKRRKEE